MQPTEPIRYTNRHDDPGVGWFTIVLDADRIIHTTVQGKGTVKGTRALVRMFDEIAELRTTDETVDAFMDLTGLSKTPLRAQAILGKWLLLHHKEIDRVAVFGARPWERRIAQAILKIARFDRAAFFKTRDEAARWLCPDRG